MNENSGVGTHCHCFIIPPHILDRMSTHPDPKVRAAAVATSFATYGLRVQRSILSEGMHRSVSAGQLRRTIYDARGMPDLPGALVRGEGSAASGEPAVEEAYGYSGDTYTFYKEIFRRSSVDGRGLRLDSTVHYCEQPNEPFDNAFWNGEQMIYGDGDGVLFGRFTASLDVVGHELTHGVTQYEAGLEYHGQPGALNESMSDVFGSMLKQWKRNEKISQADWLIGKELCLFQGALRSMKAPGTAYDDPRIGKDPQPDRMSDFAQLPDTRRGDWGGVHVNSGIPNRAFYLACVNLGGDYSWVKAGRVWYTALTSRLTSTSTFADAANATVSAAGELFGAAEANAVRDAWRQVEVLPQAGVA